MAGYPVLRGLRVCIQAPFMHCTGTIARLCFYFVLAMSPDQVAETTRARSYAVTSKGFIDGLYLREWRGLVGIVVACPQLLCDVFDGVFLVMFKVLQLLFPSWMSSISGAPVDERQGALSIVKVAAAFSARSLMLSSLWTLESQRRGSGDVTYSCSCSLGRGPGRGGGSGGDGACGTCALLR